ncbi:MAG: hypothetical protein ACYDFU_01850 [Nitrospirota bacterium]
MHKTALTVMMVIVIIFILGVAVWNISHDRPVLEINIFRGIIKFGAIPGQAPAHTQTAASVAPIPASLKAATPAIAPTPAPAPITVAAPKVNEEERRKQELKSLMNPIAVSPGKPNMVLVIEATSTKNGTSPENTLYGLLKGEQKKANVVTNLFDEQQFKAKGLFADIYGGDTNLLRQTGALSKVDYLILGKLKYTFQKGGDGLDSDLVSCSINFSYKVINKNAEITRSDTLHVVGAGFSEDAALERGLEILSEKYSEKILGS